MTTEWIELNDLQAVAIAQSRGWEIEGRIAGNWSLWDGDSWTDALIFRARPKQPKVEIVKSLCWRNKLTGNLYWNNSEDLIEYGWQRFPAGDLEGEVTEGGK